MSRRFYVANFIDYARVLFLYMAIASYPLPSALVPALIALTTSSHARHAPVHPAASSLTCRTARPVAERPRPRHGRQPLRCVVSSVPAACTLRVRRTPLVQLRVHRPHRYVLSYFLDAFDGYVACPNASTLGRYLPPLPRAEYAGSNRQVFVRTQHGCACVRPVLRPRLLP